MIRGAGRQPGPPDSTVRRQDVIDLLLRLASAAQADAKRLDAEAGPGVTSVDALCRRAQFDALVNAAKITRVLPSAALYDSEASRPTLVDFDPPPKLDDD